MAPSTAINTRTLAALPTLATLGVTILMDQTFFQIAKIAARGNTAHLLEPQATLLAKIAARGSTVHQQEPYPLLLAKIAELVNLVQ